MEPQCPKDWYTFEDSCYVVLSIKTHWLNGYLKCENIYSEYLVFESDEEIRFIYDTLVYVDNDHFYVGAEDYMRSLFHFLLLHKKIKINKFT